VNQDRHLLRHFLGAIAYRTQKALRGASGDFVNLAAGHGTRTPGELLRHIASVMGYTKTLFLGGAYPMRPAALPTLAEEASRFHALLAGVGELLASDHPCQVTVEQLLQGPLADTMTHAGQLAMLRRLAGDPVAPENFIFAAVDPGRLGPDQALPARPDADWPEPPA
jgi:hypothetical protein